VDRKAEPLLNQVLSITVALAAALAFATPCLPASAQEAAAPKQVEVIYMVAKVHNDSGEIDRKLGPFASSLLTMGYTGGDYLTSGKWTMKAGEAQEIGLESGHNIQIQLREVRAAEADITVYITRPSVTDPVKVELTIKANAAMIAAGMDFEGGKLAIPIRVKYP
jgi:uncharacterized membrane protein